MTQEKPNSYKSDDRFQKLIKLKFFEFNRYLLESFQGVSPFIFYLLFFIQGLQILWFSIHPSLDFLGEPLLLQYIRIGIKYLSFQGPLKDNNELLPHFIIGSCCLTLIHIGFLAASITMVFRLKQKQKLTYAKKIIIKITSFQILVFNTILTIPIFSISLTTILCNKDNPFFKNSSYECFVLPHIIFFILAVINLVKLAIETLYFWFFLFTKDPFSLNYFAAPSNLQRLAKFILKVAPSIYFLIDYQKDYQDVYLFVYFGITAFNLVMLRLLSSNQYSYQNFCVQFFIQNVNLWFVCNLLIAFYLQIQDNNNLIMIEVLISGVLFSFSVQEIYRKMEFNFLIQNLTKPLKKNNMNKFMKMIIEIFVKKTTFLKINTLSCMIQLNKVCDKNMLQVIQFMSNDKMNSVEFKNKTIIFLIDFLKQMKKQNSSIELKYIQTSLLYEKGSKIIAFHKIAEVNQQKLSIADEFMYYSFKATHSIYESQISHKQSDENITKVQKYLQFTELKSKFEREIESATKITQEFWEQLCEDSPSMKKVFNLAFINNERMQKIYKLFQQIQIIYPENISSIYLYNAFLRDVGTNFKEKKRVELKMEQMSKKTMLTQNLENNDERIKFIANENMGVMTVGTTHSDLGVISSSNSEVKALLGYQRIQLIGQKVTKIMPKVYQDIHDSFVLNYLEKSDQIKLPVEKKVFGMKKDCQIIEMFLAVKIFPSLIKNFEMVGFLKNRKKSEENAVIMVNLNNMEVVGISQKFVSLVNNSIKLNQANREFLKFNQIFPDFIIDKPLEVHDKFVTILRFTDCTDKLIQLEEHSEDHNSLGQEVVLSVKQIHNYQNIDLAIIEINLKIEISSSLSLQRKVLANFVPKESQQQKKKQRELERDGNQFETDMQEDKTLTLDKKVKDFIKNNSYIKQIKWSKIVLILLMLIFIGGNIFLEIVQNNRKTNITSFYKQIQISEQIQEKGGILLMLNQRIYQIFTHKQIWLQRIKRQKQIISSLQNLILNLFQFTSQRENQSLCINEEHQYEFINGVDESGSYLTQKTVFIDGFFQILFLAKQSSIIDIQKFSNLTVDLQKSRYFIRQNMEKLVPKINENITIQYSKVFDEKVDELIIYSYIFSVLRIIVLILLYVGVILMICKFNKFSEVTAQIYSNILKWDSYELESRCRKFFVESLDDKTYNKKQHVRNSELLKILPKTLIIELSDIQKQNPNKIQINLIESEARQKKNYLSSRNIEESSPLMQKKRPSILSNRHTQNILIKNQFNIKIKNFIASIFILAFLGLQIGFFLMLYGHAQKSIILKNDIYRLGNFSKNTIYSFYFGYSLLKDRSNLKYEKFYFQQLSTFYQSSSDIQEMIGQPYTNLKDIYLIIGNLNALIQKNNQSDLTKTLYFKSMEEAILQQLQLIQDLRSQRIEQIINDKNQNVKQQFIIKLIISVILSFFFLVFILYNLFHKIYVCNIQSSCLLQILPLWLIDKSDNIKKIITGQKQQQDRDSQKGLKSSRTTNRSHKRLLEQLQDERNLLQNSSFKNTYKN